MQTGGDNPVLGGYEQEYFDLGTMNGNYEMSNQEIREQKFKVSAVSKCQIYTSLINDFTSQRIIQPFNPSQNFYKSLENVTYGTLVCGAKVEYSRRGLIKQT